MDRADRRQAMAGQRVILCESDSNNNQVPKLSKSSRRSSNSKFNRILGNLERSILSQFNHSERNPANCKSKQRLAATTSAKREQIVHLSQQQGGSANEQTASPRQKHEHRLHEATASQQQPANRDRITSSLKGSVVKSASEKFGKLTLNSKSQPQESPRQPSSLCPSLATSRLSIPPPHANDEARSLNQTLLFGNGAMQLASEHHQPLLDTANRVDISASSATMNATQSREGGQLGSNAVKCDRLLAEQQYSNRLNSSPAISARSLPATGPKPGSHHRELRDSSSKKSTSQEDEEESGFATYQSRRALLQNFQQKQRQLESESNSNDNMILNRMNYFPNHPAMNQIHHPMRHSQVMTNHHQQNSLMMMPNNSFYRHNQAMTMSSNQVPIIPLRNSHISVRQDGYNMNQRVPPVHSGYMFQQNQEQVPSYPFQQSNLFDNHHLSQVQRMNEQQQSNDSSQQIYANAPPKPRRYQYYDGPATTTTVTSQAVVNACQGMMHRSSANTNTPPTMTMAPIPRPLAHTLQPLPNQQLVFNHQGQLCSQVQYPLMLRSGVPLSNPQSSGTSNLRPIQQFSHNDLAHQQFRGHIGNIPQQPQVIQMMKSKSSLDAGDVMRFKQNRQLQSQVSHDNQQPHMQPQYGYRQDEKRINQTMNIHLPLNYDQNRRQPLLSVPSGNLQRSKSVTHLLPESNQDYQQDLTRLNHSDQYSSNGLKYMTSASTNHLNDIGMSQHGFVMTNGRLDRGNDCNRIQLINHQPISMQQGPNQQSLDTGAGIRVQRAQQSQHRAPISSKNHNMGANQFYRARSMAALNSDPMFSIRTTRHSPGNVNVSQEGGGFRKPSLDDQIKHLLIGGLDNSIVSHASNINGGVGTDNRATSAIYRALDGDNRSLGVAPSRAMTASRGGTEVAKPVAWARNVHTDQKQHDSNNQVQVTAATRHPAHTSVFDRVDSNLTARQSSIQNRVSSVSNLSLAELSADMGNRQQGQYHLKQVSDAETQKNSPNSAKRHSDANSQLIVDLTTPRVLARTQTTLLPITSQPSESWSINQVGLPQMSPSVQSVDTSSPQTIKQCFKPSSVSSSNSPKENKEPIDDQQSEVLDEPRVEKQPTDDKIPGLERSAPYYYSDLKSREQREALRNIVQQKSLSPPPKLLSRSTDQSSTRLALRSATLHPGHARTLSDNLAQRQRSMSDIKAASGSLSQSQVIESSSTSSIAKNIDKLFERLNRSDDDDAVSSHDDEDFIEFLSNDNSSHHSQFEASQFSASDFNTSTSTSESSTSGGAVDDSLNSSTSTRKKSLCKERANKLSDNSPMTIGKLKNRRCSYDGASSPNNKQIRQGLATNTNDKKSTKDVANEKFKNVLGNVVDVDICPMNNLSQGCSPVSNQLQTSCAN